MKRAKIAELKNNLSRYLDRVRAGESVLILDRDTPIARLVPLQPEPSAGVPAAERLSRLERQGVLRRGTGRLPAWFGRRRPPKLRGSVLADLLRERRSGW